MVISYLLVDRQIIWFPLLGKCVGQRDYENVRRNCANSKRNEVNWSLFFPNSSNLDELIEIFIIPQRREMTGLNIKFAIMQFNFNWEGNFCHIVLLLGTWMEVANNLKATPHGDEYIPEICKTHYNTINHCS